MGLKKILEKLGLAVDVVKSANGNAAECDELKSLVKKLREKRARLQKKLASESDSSKLKSLKLDLKITNSQMKKARKTHRKHCKP